MKRFVRIKQPALLPQACGILADSEYYHPVFLHATVDQDRPVGSQGTFQPHVHDFYHLVLYTKGRGFYQLEGVYQPARTGTCVLISPHQTHEFISRRENTVYSEITFAYENRHGHYLRCPFEHLLSVYSGSDTVLASPLQIETKAQLRQLQNYIVQVTDYLNSSREQSLYQAHRRLASIFDFLIEHGTPQRPLSMVDDRFQRVRMWIEEHYQETFSMEELSKMAGLSRGSFFRTFKKTFGVSPLAYQQSLRIEAAKTLLHATSLHCNEIAWRTGFESACFFHRVFRKHVGMTPRQYRRRSEPLPGRS